MDFRRRLVIGAGVLGGFALLVALAAIILGPGNTIKEKELSSVVLQADDVQGGFRVDSCDDSPGTENLPDGRITVFFAIQPNQDQRESLTCLQATVAPADSEADATAAFDEYRDFYLEYEKLLEDPNFEDAYKIEQFETPDLGSRSFGFSIGCGRDCTSDSTVAYVIQFQRANLFSIVALGGPQNEVTPDDLIGYAEKQDRRIVTALNAND